MASSSSWRRRKQDHFNRLPDDLLLDIINKILNAKALVRLSLVSKRFFSLVFKTDSVSVDVYRPRGQYPRRVRLPKSRNPCSRDSIIQRFQQIKHLHLRFCGRFGRKQSLKRDWSVSVFGSHFGFSYHLMAVSVKKSNPSVATTGIDSIHPYSVGTSKLLERHYNIVRETILRFESEMLESVIISIDLINGKVLLMGKEEIARLRSLDSNGGISNVGVIGYSVPTLCLGELGYTLENVLFVPCIAENHSTEQVMDVPPFLDQSDFEEWKVFNGAVQILLDKIRRE